LRFADDSPLEGDGFELSVPGTKEPTFVAEGELRDRTGAAKKGCFLCGTDGSNPSPSRRESRANSVIKCVTSALAQATSDVEPMIGSVLGAAQVFESDRGAIRQAIEEDRFVTNTPRKKVPTDLAVPRDYIPGVLDELMSAPCWPVPRIVPHLLSPLCGARMRTRFLNGRDRQPVSSALIEGCCRADIPCQLADDALMPAAPAIRFLRFHSYKPSGRD
jgi:hypothetical protein